MKTVEQTLIEDFESILDSANPDMDDDILSGRKAWFDKALKKVAQSAREDERREILEKLPEKAVRDDSSLPPTANETEKCTQEAHNNMADGFNFCLNEVGRLLNPPTP